MANNNVWLEVRKDSGAILSYFLEKPEAPSATVDYIETSQDELLYLNNLENYILPAGMIASVDDLTSFRERLEATKKAKATQHASVTQKPCQSGPQSVTGTTSNNQHTAKKLTRSEFMAGFKKVGKPSKQGK